MDEFGRLDTGPPLAVKSLRSRFEQLTLETSQRPNSISTSSSLQNESRDVIAGGESSPRQRSTSGTFTHGPISSNLHDPHHHLRSASSSSDLQFGIRRPPPPPPPSRGINHKTSSPIPSPSPSPLLRPVPIPPGAMNGNGSMASPRIGFSSLPSAVGRSIPLVHLSQEVLDPPVSSFASLRSKL